MYLMPYFETDRVLNVFNLLMMHAVLIIAWSRIIESVNIRVMEVLKTHSMLFRVFYFNSMFTEKCYYTLNM